MARQRDHLSTEKASLTRQIANLQNRIDRPNTGDKFSDALAPHAARSAQEKLRKRVAEIDLELAALDDDDERQVETLRQSRLAAAREGSAFWFRRYCTSLAIAHGGAFVAIVAGVLQSDRTAFIAAAAFLPLVHFGVGMVMAGFLPITLWLSTLTASDVEEWEWWVLRTKVPGEMSEKLRLWGRRLTITLAFAASLQFMIGLAVSTMAIGQLGNVFQGRAAAEDLAAPAEAPPAEDVARGAADAHEGWPFSSARPPVGEAWRDFDPPADLVPPAQPEPSLNAETGP